MDVFAKKNLFTNDFLPILVHKKWNVNKLQQQNNNPSKTELVGEMDYMDHSNALKELYFPFSNIYVFFLLCSNTVSYIFYHNIFPTQNNKGIFIGLAAEWSLKIGLLLIYFLSVHLLSKNVISFFKGFSYWFKLAKVYVILYLYKNRSSKMPILIWKIFIIRPN